MPGMLGNFRIAYGAERKDQLIRKLERKSEGKSHLQFQSSVICRLGESRPTGNASAGRLIREAKKRRGYVPDDRARVVVIQNIPYGHRDDQIEAPIGGWRAARPTARAKRPRGRIAPAFAGQTGCAAIRSFARRAKSEGLGYAHVQHDLPWTAPEITRQNLLSGGWIRIEQSILCRYHAWLARIGCDARTGVEQRVAV